MNNAVSFSPLMSFALLVLANPSLVIKKYAIKCKLSRNLIPQTFWNIELNDYNFSLYILNSKNSIVIKNKNI